MTNVNLKGHNSIVVARLEISAYFELYNQRRRHQGLGKRFPDEVYWSTLTKQEVA